MPATNLVSRLALSLLSVSLVRLAQARVPCVSNIDCKTKLVIAGDSVCENGFCTNPFQSGCLKTMAKQYGKKDIRFARAFDKERICNSNDYVDQKRTPTNNYSCRKSTWGDIFTYDEVRLAPSKRISATFFSWIHQILLTELMEVPTTMEHGDGSRGTGEVSFYDRTSGFNTVSSGFATNVVDALVEADNNDGDCSQTESPCAHVLPDVWADEPVYPLLQDHIDKDVILPPTSNGMINRLGFYVPAFTATKHPELSSIFGLSGEQNRKKLAETFLTPTTWQEYCEMFDCSSNQTTIALRSPIRNDEKGRYFVPGLFEGYFRNMAEMGIDCEENDNECFGHFVNLDNSNCEWASYAEAQLLWNDIHLRSRGPSEFNGGYSYDSMLEIWRAAYETKSHVLLWWWYPDPSIERYESTAFKFHRINFPRPTQTCLKYRQDNLNYCSSKLSERIGTNYTAACDYPVERPQKYLSRALKLRDESSEPSKRSPAYTFLNAFEIPTYAMEEMFEELVILNKDQDENKSLNRNFDGYESRETVCKWVYDNIELLELYIPLSYPKELTEKRNQGLAIAAYITAAIALALLLIVAIVTYKLREKRAFKYAQVGFLFWMVSGLLLVALGAVTSADVISNASCVVTEWCVLLGYTLELAPILVKVQAINKVTREAMRFRRIEIDAKKLKIYPILFAIPATIYLIVWTSVDTPLMINNLKLENGEGRIVELNQSCSSSFQIWSIMAYVWQALLLLCASVLAYQSRDVVEEMNESQWIGFLTYSHVMFLVFRVVVRGLYINEAILGSVASSTVSIILSLDSIAGVAIYFGPKIYSILTEDSPGKRKSGLAGATTFVSERRDSGDVSGVARLRKLGISVVVRNDSSVVSRNTSIPNNFHEECIKARSEVTKEAEKKSLVENFPVPMEGTGMPCDNSLNASPEAHFDEQFDKEEVEELNGLARIKMGEEQDNNDSYEQGNSKTNELESNSQARPSFDHDEKLVCGNDDEKLVFDEAHDDPLPTVMNGEQTRANIHSLIEEQDAKESNETKAGSEAAV